MKCWRCNVVRLIEQEPIYLVVTVYLETYSCHVVHCKALLDQETDKIEQTDFHRSQICSKSSWIMNKFAGYQLVGHGFAEVPAVSLSATRIRWPRIWTLMDSFFIYPNFHTKQLSEVNTKNFIKKSPLHGVLVALK